MTSMTGTEHRTLPPRQALCCECGNLRTVKARASRRNHVSMGESPERIAELMHFAPDYWSRISAYHRLLEDLKCTPCGKVTQHASVRPAGSRDWAEEENQGALDPATEDPGDVLERTARKLGIRIVEVDDLPIPVIYLRRYGIALVDADLTPETRAASADWLLSAATSGDR